MSENTTVRKEFEIYLKAHAEIEAELGKRLDETRDDMRENAKEYDTLRAKVGKLEK